jgi:hypothetical protein
MRSRVVEVRAVLAQGAAQLALVQDQEVIEALASDAPQEALARGVRARCPDGRAQHRDPTARRDAGERGPVLAVVVADEGARGAAEGRRLAQLLRYPGVRRVPRDANMDDPTRAE